MAIDELVKTVAWCVVAVFAIQGCTLYCLVRFLTTGRPLFERRPATLSQHLAAIDR